MKNVAPTRGRQKYTLHSLTLLLDPQSVRIGRKEHGGSR